MTGQIFDIQHFAVHDGPGIRTLVFLKGCPLRCLWCCNPESQSGKVQLRHLDFRCKGCHACLPACPFEAIRAGGNSITINRGACARCVGYPCVEACPNEALQTTGYEITPQDLLPILMKDADFYRNSGGGVTFSGGEPLMQPQFLAEMLKLCKGKGLHTAVETCGWADEKAIRQIREWTDLFLFDLKLADPVAHRHYTGQSNEIILSNLTVLARSGARIIIRFPIIPGITDTPENVGGIIVLMRSLGLTEIDLEPYHAFGLAKCREFGLPEPEYPLDPPSREALESLIQRFSSENFVCRVA